jgi:3-oxoacyl-[acyl-carrier protein] reductase
MDLGLGNRVAVVVGASEGIGRAIAHGLAAEGAHVALLARGGAGLERVADEIRAAQPEAEVLAIPTDVTDPEAVDRTAAAVEAHFGRVHVLVNNAGNRMRPGRQITWSDDEWMLDVNTKLFGMLRGIRAFDSLLASDGSGRIINIAGISGHMVWETAMTHAINNSAFVQATKYLATDFAPRAITVNAVTPGLVATEWRHDWAASSGATQGKSEDEFVKDVCRQKGILLNRWAEPSEVADSVVFLASSRAAYITGTTVIVDGGLCVNPRVGVVN